jgi:hypothetical protein
VTGNVAIAGRGLRPDAEWTATIKAYQARCSGRAMRGSGAKNRAPQQASSNCAMCASQTTIRG